MKKEKLKKRIIEGIAKEKGRIIAAQEEISFTVPFGDLPELTNSATIV